MAVDSWTAEGMDWTNPNPKDTRYATAINRAIKERADLIGIDIPNILKYDLQGQYLKESWKAAVDETIFNTLSLSKNLAANYIIPINDSSKYEKTFTETADLEYNYLRCVKTTNIDKIFNLNTMIVISEAYGAWVPIYLPGNKTVYARVTGYGQTPPRYGFNLRTLLYQLGDPEFVPYSSDDDKGWARQRKLMLDQLRYLPDTRSDCGGKQDWVSTSSHFDYKMTVTVDEHYFQDLFSGEKSIMNVDPNEHNLWYIYDKAECIDNPGYGWLYGRRKSSKYENISFDASTDSKTIDTFSVYHIKEKSINGVITYSETNLGSGSISKNSPQVVSYNGTIDLSTDEPACVETGRDDLYIYSEGKTDIGSYFVDVYDVVVDNIRKRVKNEGYADIGSLLSFQDG